MAKDRRYIEGDNYLIDDLTGLKIRSSEARTQWDGTIVHEKIYSPRHPQDFVRGRRDTQKADIIRSEGPAIRTGPLSLILSTAAAAGDMMIRVESSYGVTVGDRIYIVLNTGDVFATTVATLYALHYILGEDGYYIQDEDENYIIAEDSSDNIGVIGLSAPLPYGASAGNSAVNNTNMVEAIIA